MQKIIYNLSEPRSILTNYTLDIDKRILRLVLSLQLTIREYGGDNMKAKNRKILNLRGEYYRFLIV